MCKVEQHFPLTFVKIVKMFCQDFKAMKPIVIQKGWAKVRIYECPLKRDKIVYKSYIMSWYVGKKRMRRGMASLLLAKREANAIADQLADGSGTAVTITAKELQHYRKCENLLNGIPLIRAVKYFIEHNPREVKETRFNDLVEEFLENCQNNSAFNSKQTRLIRDCLRRYGSRFNWPISLISPKHVEEYIEELPLNSANRLKHRESILCFLKYARQRGY